MIDCPAGKAPRALAELTTQGAQRLDLVVATHSDLDHLGGIFTVVTKVPTATIRLNEASVVPAEPDDKKRLKAALRSISGLRYRHVTLEDARRGDAGAVGDITWRVLTPTKAQLQLQASAMYGPYSWCSPSRLRWPGHDAGDANAPSWRAVIDDGQDVRAHVFLFPHHGASGGDAGRRGRRGGSRSHGFLSIILQALAPRTSMDTHILRHLSSSRRALKALSRRGRTRSRPLASGSTPSGNGALPGRRRRTPARSLSGRSDQTPTPCVQRLVAPQVLVGTRFPAVSRDVRCCAGAGGGWCAGW